MSKATPVGMIGLGIMGSAMSMNLARAGFAVHGYDIDPAARATLREAGGHPATSALAAARRAGVVITSLPSAAALEATVATLSGKLARGTIIVETSTLPIEVKEAARAALAKGGITLLDCPLSGTGAQARNKDLLLYASGDEAAYERCKSIFDGFCSGHFHVGPFGNGSKLKFIANLLVAIHNVAAGEAFALAIKAGIDPAMMYKVIAGGAGGSRMFAVRGPMMVDNDYSDATMKVEVWQKDMKIIGDFVTRLGVAAPLFAASAPIYNAAMSAGLAKADTAAVCAVLERLSGIERPARRRTATSKSATRSTGRKTVAPRSPAPKSPARKSSANKTTRKPA
jgi:3-hydroxyisobutyrate dehydrogenase-like beta-hydroxyacid dehydrogenase